MRILALDLSINCPGWCVGDDGRYIASGYQEQEDKRASIYTRIERNLEFIKGLIAKYEIEAVWLEEIAFSARSSGQMLTEQQGIIKYWCRDREIPVFSFSITAIKKFITGDGNAKKPEMIAAVQGLGYSNVYQNDEADAIAIWLYGLSLDVIFASNL